MNDKANLLRTKASRLMAQAQTLANEANEFLRLADLLDNHGDDLKEAKLIELEAIADEAENEWLQEKINERQAMKARGEDIHVPNSIAEMKAELAGRN